MTAGFRTTNSPFASDRTRERRALIERLVAKGRARDELERATLEHLQVLDGIEHLKTEQTKARPTGDHFVPTRTLREALGPKSTQRPVERPVEYTEAQQRDLDAGLLPVRSLSQQLGGRKAGAR